jgi:methionyl-tRNA formyltransferase
MRLVFMGSAETSAVMLDALVYMHAARCRPGDVRPQADQAQDGAMDWTHTAADLALSVRAFNPWPGCFTWLPLVLKSGALMRLKVLRSEALPDWVAPAGFAPGMVCDVSGEGPVVLTGRGGLRLLEAQPEGARRMSDKALLCGHPLCVGDRLNSPLIP